MGLGVAALTLLAPSASAQRPAVADVVPALMDTARIPGMSIAVIEQGRVAWTGAFGHLNDPDQTPVNGQTVFAAASLSKPVFAYVVMRLAARGAFDIDRPLAEYLPYERLQHEPRYHSITARMVMSHGSGLRNWQDGQLELLFEPGKGFNYSGEGFVYLQQAVEHVTGSTIETLAQREVFRPLGMTRTSYVWQAAFEGNAVTGSSSSDQPEELPEATEGNAAFSLLTTATDYARFALAVMTGEGLGDRADEVLSPQNPARRRNRETAADPYIFWGIGWGLQEGSAGRAFWHWGDNGAWRCYVVMFPDRQAGLVYFTNSYHGLSIAEELATRVVEDEHRALQWLDYERYDDPVRLARRAIQEAYLVSIDVGADEVTRQRAVLGDDFVPQVLRNVGWYLEGRGATEQALAAFAANARWFPDSTWTHEQYAEAAHEAGRYLEAIEAYRRSLAIDPYNPPIAKRIDWIQSRLLVEVHAVTVPRETLLRYAGTYGPRHVRLTEGGLVYQRDGEPAYPLIPLSQDLFALEGLETFRVWFVVEGGGSAQKLVGLYFNGNSDESARTP